MLDRGALVAEAGKIEIEGIVDQAIGILSDQCPGGLVGVRRQVVKELVFRLLYKGAVCQRRIDQMIAEETSNMDRMEENLLDPEMTWWRLVEDARQLRFWDSSGNLLMSPDPSTL